MALGITLGSANIRDDTESVSVVWDWNAPHAEIEIRSRSASLWASADPATMRGSARITANFGGGNEWSFMSESREGTPDDFTTRGRSMSAKLTGEYSDPVVAMKRDHGTFAALIQAHAAPHFIHWNMPHYTVPDVYVWGGFPADGAKALAELFGGIVQPRPVSGVRVEPAFPKRPSQLAGATADHALTDDAHIIEIDAEREPGQQHDCVTIRAESPDDEPTIEQGEGESVAGVSPAVLYVYWPDGDQSPAPETFTTGSAATFLTNQDHFETETIVFQDGSASVRYPIHAIVSQSWQGVSGGTMEFADGSKTIRIVEREPRVGTVQYRTRRAVYSVSGWTETVVFALARPGIDAGHRLSPFGSTKANPADEVVERWLTDLDGKKARAQAILFASWDMESVSLIVPDSAGFFQPGEIVAITSEHVSGKYILRRCEYRAGTIREDWSLEGFRWVS